MFGFGNLRECNGMHDSGSWMLRCRRCDTKFILELMDGEDIAWFAKSHACPHCRQIPSDSRAENSESWHEILEFHAKR
jgi:hypothetical protein